MRLKAVYLLSLSIISANICGCAATSSQQENLDAILWVQTSSEYAATAIGAYAAATDALHRIVGTDPTAVDRMAVVMDLDETVLDNSAYQAQGVLDDVGYQVETWDEFVALRNATAVPGAVDFITAGQDLGVKFLFITNRPCRDRADNSGDCPQKEDTLVNLRQLGIESDLDALFLKGERVPDRCLSFLSGSEDAQGRWTESDKTTRRQCVELDHDIVMLVGDQLGDFLGGLEETTPASRKALLGQYKSNWGNNWFMIPNPTYGSWLNLLQPDKRSHLRGM
jgi:acid phosphatase